MALTDRTFKSTIVHECNDSAAAGHLSEYRTLERVKTCSWWLNWKKDVVEYCHNFDRCHKANRATALTPGGDRGYNAFLVLVDRYSKAPMVLPCHKDDTAIDTAIMILNKVISNTGLFQNIISYRDPKFTSALWTNLNNLFGKKLSFSTSYHPQTDGLAERMIQALEHMNRRFCAYGLEFKESDGFTHDSCKVIPALELAYKTSIHYSTGKTPAMLEKGWNKRLPYDTLKKYLVDIQ
ncbi:hypothetical protein O181_058051 [Austropuccinia psidii MF-1]|uniref:Integrase catalytic domain-containing protein n=1 Tax=Austropuccinia psidii MF-1 TaxID=1389203 RepID=A0A9Q3HUI1_9BASI|nr:hypothetical protein [Austropuccinia psidii MF-1]